MTIVLAVMAVASLAAQEPESEQRHLQRLLGEAGNSQVDFMRALETHLEKFPQTGQRPELERALVRAAVELRDQSRVLKWGEKVLAREPESIDLLERVSRYLLGTPDPDSSKRALDYARRLEKVVTALPAVPSMARGAGKLSEERHFLLAKSLVHQSRAIGNLGDAVAAEKLAQRSYEVYPSAEAAREMARWAAQRSNYGEAVERLADAFAIADPVASAEERRRDRERLGEWYKKWRPDASGGLGDVILAAYDRTGKQVDAYRGALKRLDPNSAASTPMEFVLSGLGGDRLDMSTLKGKVVVLDFWATWCGPCRAQQPLYEAVMDRFRNNDNVVFLNISTDENREVVKPFLEQNGWKKTVYFEDGLSNHLRISSIPTTVVIDRRGEIASRMNGYVADRFVEMLSERIARLLAGN